MKKLVIMSSLLFMCLQVYAKPSEEEMQAIDECHEKLQLEKPQRPERGQRPSEADREQMEANREKIKACVLEISGIELQDHGPGPGPRD